LKSWKPSWATGITIFAEWRKTGGGTAGLYDRRNVAAALDEVEKVVY